MWSEGMKVGLPLLSVGRRDSVKASPSGSRARVPRSAGILNFDAVRGESVAAELREAGTEAVFAQLDVTDAPSVIAGVDAVVKELGGLDVAVNSAGIGGGMHLLTDFPVDDWKQTIMVNLVGMFHCLRAEIPQMEARGGSIINIGRDEQLGRADRTGRKHEVVCRQLRGRASVTRDDVEDGGVPACMVQADRDVLAEDPELRTVRPVNAEQIAGAGVVRDPMFEAGGEWHRCRLPLGARIELAGSLEHPCLADAAPRDLVGHRQERPRLRQPILEVVSIDASNCFERRVRTRAFVCPCDHGATESMGDDVAGELARRRFGACEGR